VSAFYLHPEAASGIKKKPKLAESCLKKPKDSEKSDVLNVAMFGVMAKYWREANPNLKGNIRDYATINELICLSNMENPMRFSSSRACRKLSAL